MTRICPSCGRKQERLTQVACDYCRKIYIQDEVERPVNRWLKVVAGLALLSVGAGAAMYYLWR